MNEITPCPLRHLGELAPERVGWLKDRFGLSWQIVATALTELLIDPDREKSQQVNGHDAEDEEDRHRGARASRGARVRGCRLTRPVLSRVVAFT
ncbi:MAG TPA: VOC family protein [Gaiellaceae bacterium]|jgi:hypothetical protein|nr:VOC family protein [Gaiellaceae bacterium]